MPFAVVNSYIVDVLVIIFPESLAVSTEGIVTPVNTTNLLDKSVIVSYGIKDILFASTVHFKNLKSITPSLLNTLQSVFVE